ncbi:MAG: hypothetical protein WCK91_03255, partial [bacterium]
ENKNETCITKSDLDRLLTGQASSAPAPAPTIPPVIDTPTPPSNTPQVTTPPASEDAVTPPPQGGDVATPAQDPIPAQ